jgi:3-hydroxymyristoyl/3-hydroxydecanoyl-(acyl carrier protein) dehydratase
MAIEPLPHTYPFRFVDRTVEVTGPASGRVRAVVTAGQRFPAYALPATLCEMLAQAVLLIEGGDADLGRSGFLTGISDFQIERLPGPGDILTIDVRLAGRLGSTVKFEGVIRDDAGQKVAAGALTVKKGTFQPEIER